MKHTVFNRIGEITRRRKVQGVHKNGESVTPESDISKDIKSENPVVDSSPIDAPGPAEITGQTAKGIMFEQAVEVAMEEETDETGSEKDPNKP